ncbi:chromosome transmission fidelity protein 18 homolog isoform X2 [Abrus precatorius]|uniref:Chromosome transmission fidelity protein 18 homolog n=1 Tax=Abrus precatorius TaxID=3816 RepID=A0A8B8JIU1_ABRPR|nr:chromosome transmission fidelity protein 18 homolog isoform X2 [Abrus precatorius]
MDMDTDMDIPLPEELELLESNSHFPEDQELELLESNPHFPDFDPQQSDLAIPLETKTDGHKRSRSSSDSEEEERAKVRVTVEDWLRYSPPPVLVEHETKFLKEKTLSRFASEIDGECMPVTAPNGDRVYAKLNRFQGEEHVTKLDCKGYSAEHSSEPISVILERLEQEAFAKALEVSSEGQSVLDIPETRMVHKQLWVDKYAPKSFTELLSDEQTNREVLLWLKQWDSIVFGSEIRSTSDNVLTALKWHSSIVHNQKSLNSKFQRMNGGSKWSSGGRYTNSRSMDESGSSKSIQDAWDAKTRNISPPEEKILLLCGPPGLGKTTIAHVAARHCGYDVVEVNASDDRSASRIEAKILDVVQMNSVLSDSRPKCLVVDEIDGALGDGKGAVEVLLKMVSHRKQSLGKGQLERKSLKKGQKTASLSRPVICICNDLYVPALRPLRQVAKVHMFVQPTVSRVVNRLKYICNKEGMKASAVALTALAEYTECDIRSCLNTLQFLSKKKETLNVFDIGSQVVGQKDMSMNVLDIWKEIFHRKRTKKMERKSLRDKSFEFDSLYSLMSNRGDNDLILDGIHENVVQLNYHDPLMQKTVKCFNNLGVYDLMHRYICHTQQNPLYVYLPLIAVTVHQIVSQVQKPKIEWPKSYQRYRTIMMEKMDILNTWHHKIPPHIARHLSASTFVEDLISPLLHILSPPALRPVALQLLSDTENNDLAQLVSTMISYRLTYKTMKSTMLPRTLKSEVADDLALSLVPPISDFINFKDYTSNHFMLSLAMKQVLVHEVEKHKILQVNIDKPVALSNGEHEVIETGTKSISLANTNLAAEVDVKTIENQVDNKAWQLNANLTTVPSPSPTNSAKILNLENMKKLSSSSSSFFDRFKRLNDRSLQKEATMDKDQHPLLFKFNEGFTNAVKRPVRIREFLSK